MTRPNELRADLRLTGENAMKRGLKDVGDSADRAGDQLHEMGDEAGYLTKQIAESEEQFKQFIRTFDETGDESLLKQIRRERRRLRMFEQLQKEIGGATAGGGGGIPTPPIPPVPLGMAGGMPMLIGSAAVVGAGLLPFLGAAVASAVVGGVGVGGIVGGIALAARDPRVKEAGAELGKTALGAFSEAAEPFIGETSEALEALKATTGTIAAEMGEGFRVLAPLVKPFAEGVAGMVRGLDLGGIFKASEPVIRVIAHELPAIGEALGDMIKIMAEDADGAILGFKTLSEVIQGTARATGEVIGFLSKAYEQQVRVEAAISGAAEDVFKWIPGWSMLMAAPMAKSNDQLEGMLATLDEINGMHSELDRSTRQVTYVTYGLGIAAEASAEALETQRRAMLDLVDAELSAIDAQIGVERSLDRMTESARENGRTLDIRTEAGRRNKESVTGLLEAHMRAIENERQLAIQHSATAQEAEDAARAYREQYEPALRAAIVATYGNTEEVRRLLGLLDKLDGRRITYTLIQQGGRTIGIQREGGFIPAGFEGRASGGPVEPHRLYRVNESGVELLATGSQGGRVYSAAQSAAMMRGSQQPTVSDSGRRTGDAVKDTLMDLLWPDFLKRIRVDGGDLSSVGAA